ncbi:glycerophosphodiester phosphodiesterase [Halonotius terrestris]|uniref:Glycerophosphodiester phosphodiesterase n=1 Tax=Halonotius terrestris TaxID=2487750 RepID=A0A8J8TCT1_9EURY|nr:glycerophosphodiester phosphodiesterase [Halonotius terrestris]TQQ81339.1 glycerophosphodiester phosphodiesterase [Halonotius terrestris]
MGSTPPRVIAHRGYAADNPENTVAAMRAAAADDRTDAIEIDARLTADDRVIVFHDDDLSRLTDAPTAVSDTPVWELSYDDISQYTVGDSDESIPLLADVLAAIPASIAVNLELKHPGREGLQFGAVDDDDARTAAADRWRPFVERALDIATATDHDLLVSSFYEGALAATRAGDPAVPVAPLVVDDVEAGIDLAARYDAAAIHPPLDGLLDESGTTTAAGDKLLERAREADRRVNVWTVTSRAEATALGRVGVDGIITDTPSVVPASW